jgi:hypothetical protein
MSDDVVIFLSYAHDDDLVLTPGPDELGFVSFLDQQLRLKLRDLGARQAKVWRDHRRIDEGDQFSDIIDNGLSQAELFVVVMSPNWMQRPYCRKEFETFLNLRKAAGVASPATRMLVVGKGYVDRSARPPELQGQEGFLFYSRDDEDDVRAVTPFFNRGQCDKRFYAELDDLAGGLQKRVTQILSGAPAAQTTQPPAPIVTPNGRTVFLAKPASDMKAAYIRLVTELQGKGFTVAPDPSADMPSDSGAEAFLNDALSKAEVFVHLVGDSGGFAPEGLDNIVKRPRSRVRRGRSSLAALSGRQKFLTRAVRLLRVRQSSAIL